MNKKTITFRFLCFVSIFFCSGVIGKAQNTIIALTPPNDFKFEDLWNITITTDANNTYSQYQVGLRVFDTHKGLLLETFTAPFTINNNQYTINSSTLNAVAPFNYTFGENSLLRSIIQRGGLFPAGDYRFDYSVIGINGAVQTKIADYTLSHSVIMPAFLQLVSVFDKDSLKESNPTFMWLPASATHTEGNYETEIEYKLTYTISIVEVLTNQTPYAAMTSNPKFFYQQNLENTLLTYPYSARKFEPCKTYAWQVRGIINGQTVISSEIWTFTTPCEQPLIIPNSPVLVKNNPDLAICNVLNNTVYFAYYEEYAVEDGATLNATIYDTKNKAVVSKEQLGLLLKTGYNTFTINTCPKNANLLNGQNYLLVITNTKNEKWYLRIINNQTTNTCY